MLEPMLEPRLEPVKIYDFKIAVYPDRVYPYLYAVKFWWRSLQY